MTVLELMVKGGWIMVMIALCSIVGVWVYIERLMLYRKLEMSSARLLETIRPIVSAGRIEEAQEKLGKIDTAPARVVRIGLSVLPQGRDATREALEGEASRQVYILEDRTAILATVAGIAPLLGFLGTVLGMIKAFQQIENLGGNVNATVLAGGIWEAMVTTAAGLAVGIPAIVAYNHLSGKLRTVIAEMESASNGLLTMAA
jgi:biopolymer transport protein ExbB